MNYELYKQLENAKFPFRTSRSRDWMCKNFLDEGHAHDEHCLIYGFVPTLEELIEACGEQFEKLENMTGGRWDAEGHEVFDVRPGFRATGKTAVEAVARLWLALHKK